MILLQPAALAFAALAPVIVLLYLLKVRRQAAQVSTLMFWQRVLADNRRRALFQRLRQILSLLLHLLIFALLLLALARPEFRAFHGAGADFATVVILDCRARMQARAESGISSFEAGRNAAAEYLRRASPDRPVALLAAESAPRIAIGFTGAEKPLLDGLRALRAADAGGRLEDAIRTANDLLSARSGSGRIVLITDRAPDAYISGSPLELRLTISDRPRENVGITRFSARPLPNSPETSELFVEVENFGATRQTGSVELSRDGALLDVKPFDLAPGERHPEVYPTLSASDGLANARGWLTAHLASAKPDAYTLDDNAYAVIPPPRPLRALLVTRGNLYLESLLKADPTIRFDQLAPSAFASAQAAAFDAVILDDCADFPNADALPAGNFVFLRRTPFDSGDQPLDRPAVTDLNPANPVLRLISLRDTLFFHAAALVLPKAPSDWQLSAPARALDRPLIVTGERRGQRLAAFAFGATDSELPLRVAFPLLMRNALTFVAGRDESAAARDTRAGETTLLPAGEAVWTRPRTQFAPLPAAIPSGEWIRGPGLHQPTQNGFYLHRGADGHERWTAVNTADREMSALNGNGSLPSENPPPSRSLSVRVPAWPPWTYLALAAFALCAAEWFSFHRRRTE